jgi:hypothetical protein
VRTRSLLLLDRHHCGGERLATARIVHANRLVPAQEGRRREASEPRGRTVSRRTAAGWSGLRSLRSRGRSHGSCAQSNAVLRRPVARGRPVTVPRPVPHQPAPPSARPGRARRSTPGWRRPAPSGPGTTAPRGTAPRGFRRTACRSLFVSFTSSSAAVSSTRIGIPGRPPTLWGTGLVRAAPLPGLCWSPTRAGLARRSACSAPRATWRGASLTGDSSGRWQLEARAHRSPSPTWQLVASSP